ncbi:hypothetical protein [Gordonia phthalatica]|uniref:Uncharacterized protein n=1 Tax=Gordonia phthalatica TaxID=1136941 RepID=A0A0N9NEQ7_9ACTN|nr:hypothetical protein [Gordonia phthalatica]ALG86173.1 hypothetical protein ACH46_18825 [Gordonia phthalatica]
MSITAHLVPPVIDPDQVASRTPAWTDIDAITVGTVFYTSLGLAYTKTAGPFDHEEFDAFDLIAAGYGDASDLDPAEAGPYYAA